MLLTESIDREKCPICGKMLPITIVKGNGVVYISVFCKHCGKASVIKVTAKEE